MRSSIFGIVGLCALPMAAQAQSEWHRVEVGPALLAGRFFPSGRASAGVYGPALTLDAVKGLRMTALDRYGFWGVTGALAPWPSIAGERLDGTLAWTAAGGGYHWRLGDSGDWGIEGAAYLGAAWSYASVVASSDLAFFLRMRVGHRWALDGGDFVTLGGGLLWFRTEDDLASGFVTHHGVLSVSVGWAVYGHVPR